MSEEEPNIPSPRGENFNPHEHLTEEEKEAIWRSRDALKGEREAFLGLEHAPPCAQGAWREIWKSGIAFVARGDTFNVNFGPEVHIQLKLADDIESFEPDEEPFSVSRYRDPSESDFKMTVVQVRDVRPGEEMFGSVRLMGESENGYPAWWRFFDFSYLPLTRRDSEEWMLEDEVEALRSGGMGRGDGWTPALKEAFEKQDLEGFLREIPAPGPECFYPSDDGASWDDLDLKARELDLLEEADDVNEADSD